MRSLCDVDHCIIPEVKVHQTFNRYLHRRLALGVERYLIPANHEQHVCEPLRVDERSRKNPLEESVGIAQSVPQAHFARPCAGAEGEQNAPFW